MRPAAPWLLLALLASGCLAGEGGGAGAARTSTPGPGTDPSSGPVTTAATPSGPAPDWDFALPPLPEETAGTAGQWHRGADLGPAWNATAGAGPGLYQLVWWIEDVWREPPPGYACGPSLGTRTDFDVVHRAVRTGWEPLLADGAVALASRSQRDHSTSCGGKQHLSVLADGAVVAPRGSGDADLPFTVLPNGTVRLSGTGLWLAAGQTAESRTDHREDPAGSGADVHVTGLARVVHLGAWDRERIWVEDDVCADGPDRSLNCMDRGHGP